MKVFANVFALVAALAVFSAAPAFAQEGMAMGAGPDAVKVAIGSTVGWIGLGIGIMMGLAVFGGAMSQARAASTALDGIARNPAAAEKLNTPMILALALMESLVLFAFLIGLFLQGSVSKVLDIVVK